MNVVTSDLNWIKLASNTVLLLMLLSLSISFSGCAYKTYTGSIGDASYSFQYRKYDRVNPYNPWSGPSHPQQPVPAGDFYPESHINVDVFEIDSSRENAKISLECFVSSLTGNEYIRDFKIMERGSVIIAGETAEYVKYFYYGYTTMRVPYEGKFASFLYENYIVDIDVLFEYGNVDTDIAFNHLVETFRILD